MVDEITIIYKNFKENEVRLFGEKFVKNNKDNCKIIINNKILPLKESYVIDKNDEMLEIKLTGIKNIKNMSYMFFWCQSLSSLPDISKWDTSNVTNMSWMFSWCISLQYLPDISRLNTSNVTDISYMFYGCKSLLYT